MTHFGLNYPWKKKRNLWNSKKQKGREIQKSRKEEKENEPRVLSWMVDCNTLYGLMIYIYIYIYIHTYFADLRIVVYYLCKKDSKRIFIWLKCEFLFLQFMKKRRKGREQNEVEDNRKGSWKKEKPLNFKRAERKKKRTNQGFSLEW